MLEFEESSYSVKLSYGRMGVVFRFNVIAKTAAAPRLKEKHDNSEFVKTLSNDQYTFKGNYSLEYLSGITLLLDSACYSVPSAQYGIINSVDFLLFFFFFLSDQLLSNLRISRDGRLEVIGNIVEGFYSFDVVAVDFRPDNNSSVAVLRTRSKVYSYLF